MGGYRVGSQSLHVQLYCGVSYTLSRYWFIFISPWRYTLKTHFELYMNDISNFFFELIQLAIGTRICISHTPSASEWGELYSMAKRQALVGVCFAGVQRLQGQHQEPPEMLYLTWMGMAAKIQQRNETVNKQCVELQAKLAADGFRSCILKGQGIATLYGDLAMLRQSGDIDIWMDGGLEKVMDYVNARTPNREFDIKHTHFEVFDDTIVETHWRPSASTNPILNRKLTAYFEREKNRQFNNLVRISERLGICAPTDDFQFVHAMLHVYGHFLYEGVGMRQMMDLFFAHNACIKSSTVTEVQKVVEDFGLVRMARASMWVFGRVFNMPEHQMMWEPDSEAGKELLDEIMLGGNFGHYNVENRQVNDSFSQRMIRRLRRRARLIRFNPMGLLFAPFGKVKILLWKHQVIKKYNL